MLPPTPGSLAGPRLSRPQLSGRQEGRGAPLALLGSVLAPPKENGLCGHQDLCLKPGSTAYYELLAVGPTGGFPVSISKLEQIIMILQNYSEDPRSCL